MTEAEGNAAGYLQRRQSVTHEAEQVESGLRDELTNLNGELRAIQSRLVLKVADCDRLEQTDAQMRAAVKELEQQCAVANQKREEAERFPPHPPSPPTRTAPSCLDGLAFARHTFELMQGG